MRQVLLVAALAAAVVLGVWEFHAAAQTYSGRWLIEFPKDDPPRSYSCAVYQYRQGYTARLICEPLK